jgi:hypothetical protein
VGTLGTRDCAPSNPHPSAGFRERSFQLIRSILTVDLFAFLRRALAGRSVQFFALYPRGQGFGNFGGERLDGFDLTEQDLEGMVRRRIPAIVWPACPTV